MFNSMRDEVRRCLVVASELGGEAAQYVRVLRNEKERLLPVDVSQEEVDALMSDRDNADVLLARDAALVDVKKQLDVATSNLTILRVTNDEYKKQLTRQSEELELMQTNRVHAEVYQNVAAERDRALAELRTSEQAYQKELNKQHAGLCACRLALVREQECRTELARELQGCIKDERANLAKVRTELEQMTLSRNSLQATLDSTQAEWKQTRRNLNGVNDKYDTLRAAFNKSEEEILRLQTELCNAQAAVEVGEKALTAERNELDQFVMKAIMTLGVPAAEIKRGFSRNDLLAGIRSLRKDLNERESGRLYLALKSAEDKLSRVAAALEAPIPLAINEAVYTRQVVADIITAAVLAPIREALKDE